MLDEAREAIIGYAMSHTSTSTCSCIYHPDGDGVVDLTNCPMTVSCPTLLPPPAGDTTATLTIPARHYLPCPDKFDDGDPATTNDGDGVEEDRVAGSCPQPVGYLPWVTLGTAAQDAWGNRLLYAVTDSFSNSAGFSGSDLDKGDLQICSNSANTSDSDCGTLGNVAGNVPVVILSFGPNGWGALNVNRSKLAAPSSNNEKENANTDLIDREFVSRTPSDDFDDLVKWISAHQLRGRICPPGGCP